MNQSIKKIICRLIDNENDYQLYPKCPLQTGSCRSVAFLQCRSIRCNDPPVVGTVVMLINKTKGRGQKEGSHLRADLSV